jgi:hypothetical protein
LFRRAGQILEIASHGLGMYGGNPTLELRTLVFIFRIMDDKIQVTFLRSRDYSNNTEYEFVSVEMSQHGKKGGGTRKKL